MLSKTLFAALLLTTLGCDKPPPVYSGCAFIDNKKDPVFLFCASSDEAKRKDYSVWLKDADDYICTPPDDYGALKKWAKQIEKDLERCKNR